MDAASSGRADRKQRRRTTPSLSATLKVTRREANLLIDGALLTGGVLAVVDNALVHWVLRWHRLVQGWSGTLYAEVALSLAGVGMLVVAATRLRRRAREAGAAEPDAGRTR
jgi:hypothetical protein